MNEVDKKEQSASGSSRPLETTEKRPEFGSTASDIVVVSIALFG